jgi:hypothetical protein
MDERDLGDAGAEALATLLATTRRLINNRIGAQGARSLEAPWTRIARCRTLTCAATLTAVMRNLVADRLSVNRLVGKVVHARGISLADAACGCPGGVSGTRGTAEVHSVRRSTVVDKVGAQEGRYVAT